MYLQLSYLQQHRNPPIIPQKLINSLFHNLQHLLHAAQDVVAETTVGLLSLALVVMIAGTHYSNQVLVSVKELLEAHKLLALRKPLSRYNQVDLIHRQLLVTCNGCC
jgi:hypothetical protein